MGNGSIKIGFLGLGDMGLPMARRLSGAGLDLIVWNRSRETAEPLAAEGVQIAVTPADVAREADLIGLCLTSDAAVEEVAFGPMGLFAQVPGRLRAVADFSTGAVGSALDFARRASARGVAWVDAPVSGGVPAATDGRLVIFAGGEQAAIVSLHPLLAPLSVRVTRMGQSGAGQATKICNQAIVAANMLVMAETIAMARRSGIDVARLPEALTNGFADSAPLQIFGPRMADHNFDPRLGSIALMVKDTRLATDFAAQLSAETPMLQAAHAIYARISEDGTPSLEEDLSALIRLYESKRYE
jgi:3-hydroxyisobutyrate dehydrogenase-like beta-hydroxyacid dehydrogenase